MRAFYTILCLSCIMLGAITVNHFYISGLSANLITHLEQLELPTEENNTAHKAIQLRRQWEYNRPFVQITVNHTEIEMISNAVDELCVFAEHQNIAEFERARKLLVNALEELGLSEELSITNIL